MADSFSDGSTLRNSWKELDPNNLKDYIPHPFHMINGDNGRDSEMDGNTVTFQFEESDSQPDNSKMRLPPP
ncbi:hypothetical protein Pdw03_2970 [Penicillium digitatum]|uniref:Uncharacterized protein n=1 Tax=Penicillium digitatum TaxID=36651 RepID=A0A7T7BHR4_PENDI|nr:hypothetical protein Pdw03_2970 [Penicillium digitatum]